MILAPLLISGCPKPNIPEPSLFPEGPTPLLHSVAFVPLNVLSIQLAQWVGVGCETQWSPAKFSGCQIPQHLPVKSVTTENTVFVALLDPPVSFDSESGLK